jgi:glutaredoxin
MLSSRVRVLGSVALAAALALTLAPGGHAATRPAPPPRVEISSAVTTVTVYGADWCGACKSLEAKLAQRNVPFEKIDVDRNREAYERARTSAGMGNGIPLTHVAKESPRWFVGDDAEGIERAYKGD